MLFYKDVASAHKKRPRLVFFFLSLLLRLRFGLCCNDSRARTAPLAQGIELDVVAAHAPQPAPVVQAVAQHMAQQAAAASGQAGIEAEADALQRQHRLKLQLAAQAAAHSQQPRVASLLVVLWFLWGVFIAAV